MIWAIKEKGLAASNTPARRRHATLYISGGWRFYSPPCRTVEDELPARAAQPDLVRRAIRLEWVTAGWMLIEAAVAIGSGVAAHSLSLIAFGADSLIELASAGVLLWRLNVEIRQGAEFPESIERRASRIGGALLFVLAAYVAASAAYGFWSREGQDFSVPGLVVTGLAIPIMWWLAKAKIRIADQIGSRALRADAVESLTCGYLSGVVLIGLVVQLLMPGWWWIDSVASLGITILLVREGREAWESEGPGP
jgi:divalent metal cation (Fe/Co/Zn/Cd) transporter